MAVRLLGLPREYKDSISTKCKNEGLKPSEYFRIHGLEIQTLEELRNNSLLFIQPSGNTFIYRILSWLSRTTITDDTEFVPDSERCTYGNAARLESGDFQTYQCILRNGHEGKHKSLAFVEY